MKIWEVVFFFSITIHQWVQELFSPTNHSFLGIHGVSSHKCVPAFIFFDTNTSLFCGTLLSFILVYKFISSSLIPLSCPLHYTVGSTHSWTDRIPFCEVDFHLHHTIIVFRAVTMWMFLSHLLFLFLFASLFSIYKHTSKIFIC